MLFAPQSRTDPIELRAIIDLESCGWTREEIMHLLRISRATYYNRKAEIRRIQEARDAPGLWVWSGC
jgi:hypothetical protein